MYLKAGVTIDVLTPQMVLAADIVWACYAQRGQGRPTITSCNDGVHKGKPVAGDSKDPHYVGKALDFSIKLVPLAIRSDLVKDIKFSLGPQFVVLHEAIGSVNEHLHVQFGHIAPPA